MGGILREGSSSLGSSGPKLKPNKELILAFKKFYAQRASGPTELRQFGERCWAVHTNHLVPGRHPARLLRRDMQNARRLRTIDDRPLLRVRSTDALSAADPVDSLSSRRKGTPFDHRKSAPGLLTGAGFHRRRRPGFVPGWDQHYFLTLPQRTGFSGAVDRRGRPAPSVTNDV